jgi:hypothetical protein
MGNCECGHKSTLHAMSLGLDIPRTRRLLRLKPQLRPQKLLQQQRRTPRLRLVEGLRKHCVLRVCLGLPAILGIAGEVREVEIKSE